MYFDLYCQMRVGMLSKLYPNEKGSIQMNLKNQIFHGSNFQCISPANYTPVNQHSNGKWTLWRCISYISYWKWVIFQAAMLVYQRVFPRPATVVPGPGLAWNGRDTKGPPTGGWFTIRDRQKLPDPVTGMSENKPTVWSGFGLVGGWWNSWWFFYNHMRIYEAYDSLLIGLLMSSRWDFVG